MAIAERRLAEEFNRDGHDLIDHRTYVICSDGDLQEGVASEASSLAGHLKLGKLIALYDDNRIQLDGPTAWAFTEDVLARFAAYGWHVQQVEDGTDLAAIDAAIRAAQDDDRPSIIAVHTVIGYGSPNKAGTQKAHGAPLGPDEVRLTKEAYGWDPDKTFYVPDEARDLFRRAIDEGKARVADWESRLAAFAEAYPGDAAELKRRVAGRLPDGWDAGLPVWDDGTEVATRNASQDAIQLLAEALPELFGGSADLSESNLTDVKSNGHDHFESDHAGRLEVGDVRLPLLTIDLRDDRRREVENLLELARCDVEQISDALGTPLKNQMCETGAARSMWPMRSRRTFCRVTSTPQRSQMMPL